MQISDLSEEQRKVVCSRLKEQAENKQITQEAIASFCECDPSYVRKIFSGKVIKCQPRILQICEFLQTEFEDLFNGIDRTEHNVNFSADQYGSYQKSFAEDYIGRYVHLRRAYTSSEKIVGSILDLKWSENSQCLVFKTWNRPLALDEPMEDHMLDGQIYFSAHLGLFHLITCHRGAIITTTLSKIIDNRYLFGAILSQTQVNTGFVISVAPVHLEKVNQENSEILDNWVGVFSQDSVGYSDMAELISNAESCINGLQNTALPSVLSNGENIVEIGQPKNFG